MPSPSSASHFIDERIEPLFERPPLLAKLPGCPSGFCWHEREYHISAILSEWHDYGRRGRSADNMTAAHAHAATRHGSWGVGRDYYRVRTDEGRGFLIYYDRAPRGADDRQGSWFVREEIELPDAPQP